MIPFRSRVVDNEAATHLHVDLVDDGLDQGSNDAGDRVEGLAALLVESEEVAAEGDALLEVVADEVAVVVLEGAGGACGHG